MMEKKIIDWINEILSGTPYFLVEVSVSGDGNLVNVSIDGDGGVDIKKCMEVNRYLNNKLTEGGYDPVLQVSSPGIDRPLKLIRQYRKNVGRKLRIEVEENVKIEGKLAFADFNKIILSNKVKKDVNRQNFQFDEIRKATVIV